eukprot:149491_1
MGEQTCATESLKPTWVTIGFVSCSLVMLIITIVISLRRLKQKPAKTYTHNTKHNKSSHKSVPSISMVAQRTNTINIDETKIEIETEEHEVETKEIETYNISSNITEYKAVTVIDDDDELKSNVIA